MLPHPVAVAADVDDVAVVEEPVDQRRRHHVVAEHAAPLLEALVRGEHRGGALVAGVDQLEEQDRAVLGDRQVADLVDHQQCGMRQHLEAARQVARRLRLHERLDQVREGAVVDAASGLGGGDRQADGQVRLADARGAEQDHVLGAVDEAELMQALDLLALDARLEGEVELGQGLHRRQPRGAHGGVQAAVVAQHDLGVQQPLDRLAGGDGPAVGLRQDVVRHLKRAGHLEVGQHRPHPVAPVPGRGLHSATSA